jgi:hypothetical protein
LIYNFNVFIVAHNIYVLLTIKLKFDFEKNKFNFNNQA